MKQVLVTIALLFSTYLSVYAQKEVYFNTTKTENIKVESMQGINIESSFSPISIIHNLKYQSKSGGFPLSIGYFNEKRITSCWTLTTRIVLDNFFFNVPTITFYNDTATNYYSNNNYISPRINGYKFEYQLGLHISIEPRWYFSYKKRYQAGKAKLNSGWYLSLPVATGVTLINTYKPPVNEYWARPTNYGSLGFNPSLGYRQAISKHMFLEGDVALLSGSIGFSKLDNKFIISPLLQITAGISIKVAYTFK
ncbi:MAG TPA: hypothetical protein VIK55_11575 [Paludibacter sp.]